MRYDANVAATHLDMCTHPTQRVLLTWEERSQLTKRVNPTQRILLTWEAHTTATGWALRSAHFEDSTYHGRRTPMPKHNPKKMSLRSTHY